jgi:hypothetical protein
MYHYQLELRSFISNEDEMLIAANNLPIPLSGVFSPYSPYSNEAWILSFADVGLMDMYMTHCARMKNNIAMDQFLGNSVSAMADLGRRRLWRTFSVRCFFQGPLPIFKVHHRVDLCRFLWRKDVKNLMRFK